MSAEPIIEIRELTKRYVLGQGFGGGGLRHVVNDFFTAPFKRGKKVEEEKTRPTGEFLALRNVTFNIAQGEVVGIVGRNGAGKSTLLKILSRITQPTSGEILIHGRVASLLEVGTGFHPDLTGRENVFLNGAILGMSRGEIRSKFDEIVAFAEVEKFIDTPVKRYSSGMYVRLAFAVAAHLEPEILIVDEVLAVGDSAFQKKCIGKMSAVSQSGRTVLFVSHNMSVVQRLCNRAVLLQSGEMVFDGTPGQVVSRYLNSLEQAGKTCLAERKDRGGKGPIRLQAVQVVNANAPESGRLTVGAGAKIIFHLNQVTKGMVLSFTFYDQMGQSIGHFKSSWHGEEDQYQSNNAPTFTWETEEVLFLPGRYRINAAVTVGADTHDVVEGAVVFDVDEGSLRGRPVVENIGFGSVVFPHRWTVPASSVGA